MLRMLCHVENRHRVPAAAGRRPGRQPGKRRPPRLWNLVDNHVVDQPEQQARGERLGAETVALMSD